MITVLSPAFSQSERKDLLPYAAFFAAAGSLNS
jgi:hypothetical protein